MLIDSDDGLANLETYSFSLQSQLRHSEIDVTHGALFFECNSIIKFSPSYQNIVSNMATFCKRVIETCSQSNISQSFSSTKRIDPVYATNTFERPF